MAREKQQTPDLPVHFVAALLGCTERQVRQLMTEGVLVKAGESLVSPRSVLDELARRRGGAAAGEEEYEAAKRRKMVADANAAEIATAREAGKLVLAKEVIDAFCGAIEIATQKLGQVGSSLGAIVILETKAAAAAEIINKANRAACEELAALDIAEIIERSRKKETEQDGGGDGGE